MVTCTKPSREVAPFFTQQEQLTLLLIGCRHAEALVNLAKGPAAQRAALAFAREVLRSLKPICPGLRHPGDLNAALIELRLAMAFGNLISLYARYGYSARVVIRHLKGSGLWKELCLYWGQRGRDPQAVVAKALALRRYVGEAAA